MQKALPGNTRERIVDLMKAHGMTQAMLAEKIGISESTLNRFLTGQTEKLSTDNLIALAGTFHVTTDFLLGLTDLPVSINADIENTFKLILSDLRAGSQDYLKQSQKLTREFMKRMMRDVPLDPHSTQRQITREVLLDKIMDSIKALDLTQEEQAQLRSAFRLLLSSANPGKRQT